MIEVKDLHQRWVKEPKYKAEYKALEKEFNLTKTLIDARVHAGLSQQRSQTA